jgi:hypothetical protein
VLSNPEVFSTWRRQLQPFSKNSLKNRGTVFVLTVDLQVPEVCVFEVIVHHQIMCSIGDFTAVIVNRPAKKTSPFGFPLTFGPVPFLSIFITENVTRTVVQTTCNFEI